jgi:ABC-type dipeptide/oligopeptide/nickel transport system permease component
VRTARAKGAPEPTVLRNHVLRNALLPVVTILGLPGLGKLSVGAIGNVDLPTVQGVVVFATLCIIVFNLVVDTLYAWVDPRTRLT